MIFSYVGFHAKTQRRKEGKRNNPQQLLNNPVFNLLILENPDIISKFPVDTLYNLLQQKNIPQLLLEFAAKHQNIEIVKAAGINVNFSGKVNTEWRKTAEAKIASVHKAYRFENKLISFGDFPEFLPLDVIALSSKKLRQSIASNLNTPVKVLELLANDENMYVRATLARNENTPVKILEQLACDTGNEDESYCLQESIAFNQKAHPSILKIIANSKYEYIRDVVNRNPNTPASTREKFYLIECQNIDRETTITLDAEERLKILANSNDNGIRRYVAEKTNTPHQILEKLAKDKESRVRERVAYNPNTPQHILEQLANDPNEEVRIWVVTNYNTPIHILDRLSSDRESDVRARVAWNKKTSFKEIKKLCFDRNSLVRYNAITCHKLPITILRKLAHDKDPLIRMGVAKNTNTPLDLLDKLIQDNNIEVRCETALNGNLDRNIAIQVLNKAIEELRQVDSSLNNDIRQSIAFDKNVPLIILEQLIDDRDVVIRKIVATNPKTPVNILKQLAETEEKEEVIRAILKHHKCSINVKRIIFDRLSRSRKPSLARLTVLLNNYADSKLLARNVNSICWLERYAIAQNIQTPIRTLEKLVEDAHCIVRAAAIDNLSNR